MLRGWMENFSWDIRLQEVRPDSGLLQNYVLKRRASGPGLGLLLWSGRLLFGDQ